MRASPPTGYLEIEHALRLLALGDSDVWIARKLHGVDHPAAANAATLLRQGRRRQAQAMLEDHAGAAGGSTQRQRAGVVQPRRAVTLTAPISRHASFPYASQSACWIATMAQMLGGMP